MAGGQPARVSAGETVSEFMERRRREVAQRGEAEAAGRIAWARSTPTGQNLQAPRAADVVQLGTRVLEQAKLRPVAASTRSPQPVQNPGTRYGNRYAPPSNNLPELQRQQAEFAETKRELGKQNSWFAAPALAAPVLALGLGGAAALSARAALGGAATRPLNFLDREAWQGRAGRIAEALTGDAKAALRKQARTKFERANGIAARDMQAQVHHSDPLEWAHLKPNADPNRLANLWGLRTEAHAIATQEWAKFSRALNGRIPTQAEIMQAKLRIDRLVEPFLKRGGIPRSNVPPGEGGPR